METENYVVTKEIMYKRLRRREGAFFTHQNRALIETIIKSPEYFSNKVSIPEKIDHNINFLNVAKVAATFARILDSAIQTNGFDTSHSKFESLKFSDMTLAITMIAILPMVAKRTKILDNLPALYFYGQAKTGKSHFFNQHPAYHQVSTDAEGVSRYQLQTNEDAFLLDDITQKILDDKRNSSTVRNLALGGTATVKVCGNTQKVRGFVVCTSNDTPDFLEKKTNDPDLEANCNAWRRRFIAIRFTKPVDEDPINAQYDYTSANKALICFFSLCYNLLEESEVKEMLSKYYLYISKQISSEDFETFKGINLSLPSFMDMSSFKFPECETLKKDCKEKEHKKANKDKNKLNKWEEDAKEPKCKIRRTEEGVKPLAMNILGTTYEKRDSEAQDDCSAGEETAVCGPTSY